MLNKLLAKILVVFFLLGITSTIDAQTGRLKKRKKKNTTEIQKPKPKPKPKKNRVGDDEVRTRACRAHSLIATMNTMYTTFVVAFV